MLRRGLHYPGRAWTQGHRRWVDGLSWPHPAERVVVEDYRPVVTVAVARELVGFLWAALRPETA